MASSPKSNPIVGLAVTAAGIAAAFIGNQVLEKGWSAVFGEQAPTEKTTKQSAKDAKAERKQAKKDGASKQEIAEISDPADDLAPWKVLLWAALSGVVIQALKLLAQRGAQKGITRLTERRPDANRG